MPLVHTLTNILGAYIGSMHFIFRQKQDKAPERLQVEVKPTEQKMENAKVHVKALEKEKGSRTVRSRSQGYATEHSRDAPASRNQIKRHKETIEKRQPPADPIGRARARGVWKAYDKNICFSVVESCVSDS